MNLLRLRSLFKAFQCKYREISLTWKIDNFKSVKCFIQRGMSNLNIWIKPVQTLQLYVSNQYSKEIHCIKRKKRTEKKKENVFWRLLLHYKLLEKSTLFILISVNSESYVNRWFGLVVRPLQKYHIILTWLLFIGSIKMYG